MARKYPAIGQIDKYQRRAKCKVCGSGPTTGRVHVQVNHMRGDDDVRNVCLQCTKVYSRRGLLYKLGYIDRNMV
jgi:hypothetical protein